MNHHVVCIGWEQGYKHVSRIPPLSVFSDQQPCQVIGKKCLGDKSSTATGLVWETTVPFVSLFWSTSMTAVTSRENTLLTNLKQSKPVLNLAYPRFPALGTRCIFLPRVLIGSALFAFSVIGQWWWLLSRLQGPVARKPLWKCKVIVIARQSLPLQIGISASYVSKLDASKDG